MKSQKNQKQFENKQYRDQFFKKSKILGYRSRASFKLIGNNKFRFIKNTNLLDIGYHLVDGLK